MYYLISTPLIISKFHNSYSISKQSIKTVIMCAENPLFSKLRASALMYNSLCMPNTLKARSTSSHAITVIQVTQLPSESLTSEWEKKGWKLILKSMPCTSSELFYFFTNKIYYHPIKYITIQKPWSRRQLFPEHSIKQG